MSHNKGKKETEAVAVTLRRYIQIVLDVLISVYMLLILVVLPFYNQEGFDHIGSDKSAFFRKVGGGMGKIALLFLALYLVLGLVDLKGKKHGFSRWWESVKKKISVTDIFAAAYVVSLLLSYGFSRYKSNALWGAAGWYMGLCLQLILMGTYFCISKCWKPKKWMLYSILPVSAAVFLLEYLNRFGIFPLQMGDYGPLFISTIGNINWYCGYQVSVFFLGVALLWQGMSCKAWQRVLLMLYVLLGFASLVTQGSSSGLVAAAVVILVMFCMSVPDGDRMYRFWQGMALLGGACLLTYGIQSVTGRKMNLEDTYINLLTGRQAAVFMTAVSLAFLAVAAVGKKRNGRFVRLWRPLARVFVGLAVLAVSMFLVLLVVNTLHPGSIGALSDHAMFTFSNTWGSNRGATWKAGALCFWEQDFLHKLVGIGPDAMDAYIYHAGSPRLLEIVTTTFPTARLTNAHNEWLTILADTGILGFVSYVGLMVSGMVRLMGKKDGNLFSRACGLCLLGYTVNNMFSFQQSMNVSALFVIFGMGEAFSREQSHQ